MGRYPWLEDFRDRSVTELEFVHGHLNNPGALPACICFRDKVGKLIIIKGTKIKISEVRRRGSEVSM